MILGKVNDALEAVIHLEALGENGNSIVIQAVIDTGFSGELTLPFEIISALNLIWRSRSISILGDGRESQFDLYFGRVMFGDEIRKVVIDCVETTPLIGMRLLQNNILTIAVCEEGEVKIAPMALI